MIKVIIDTHLLLSSIPKTGKNRWLFEAFINKEFCWVISNEIISEYAEVIEREFSSQAAEIVFSILLAAPNTWRQEPFFNWQLIEDDPDDNKFVDCAVASNADFLVTEDRHIRNLLQRENLFPPVPIVNAESFKKYLEDRKTTD